ncbi:hypothetical protein JW964_10805 [candidate division KSB1 bacterium]|nr:hypothetical protein [candidate division KSB1 bacterium]
MKINLNVRIFSSREIDFIIAQLEAATHTGYLKRRYEDNGYLLASYRGVELKGISPKWNVKIYDYNSRKGGHCIVCVDLLVLNNLIEANYDSFIPPDLPVLRIDDAGWGFPLGGVMVGVTDEQAVKTAIVPVEYFRKETKNRFSTKKYLKEYTKLAIELLDEFKASPGTHRIEICSGYVNQPLREKLRSYGYDVRVVEIKGLLQIELENIFKKYVHEIIGADIYYDPKELEKSELPRKYRECVKYGRKHCPHQLKNGWEALSGR